MEDVHRQYFITILKKYREGNATTEEVNFLESYYNTFELKDNLVNTDNEGDYLQIKLAIKKTVDKRIDKSYKKHFTSLIPVWTRYAAAAVILIFLSVGIYFLNKPGAGNQPVKQTAQNILPGSNKAILTLANGSRIVLGGAGLGQVAKQSNVSITKTAGNQIVYSSTGSNITAAAASQFQNTITTPNGGQFQVMLPDGTRVYLNSATTLTYPAAFSGSERLVQLNGEAYFEAAKNKKMPFRVKSGGQTVEVLGTHFNINSYADEAAIKTTLLEGSVKVSSGANSTLIVPGQQAIVSMGLKDAIVKRMVNIDKETAWKNGLFSFDGDDIGTIMRQVARWYDIRVQYADNLPNEKYYGEISKSSNLADVFKILELNNLHFDVEGKTVKVSYNKNSVPAK